MTRRVSVRRVGSEGEPVAIVDGFADDPDALRTTAAAQHDYAPAGRHYPGIAAPLPETYLQRYGPLIARIAREVFGAARLSVLEARFSIVTTDAAALTLEQRLPHVDAFAPGRLALIHYLVPDGTDGTAFYRHRSTGFETVGTDRRDAYFTALRREIAATPPAAAYVAGDTPLFAQLASIPGAYNRALLYRSRVLHSGAIQPGALLPADPATGRLTITGFFDAA